MIREIAPEDSPRLTEIIHEVMSEFGAVGEGYSMLDPEVQDMYSAYSGPRSAYFVAMHDGEVIGGAGVGRLARAKADVCELRKMYLLPAARGLGLGRALLEECLAAARAMDYRVCYLETLESMDRAQRLYERAGFKRLAGPLGHTGHFGCETWYALDLVESGTPSGQESY